MVDYCISRIAVQNTRGTVTWPLILYGRQFQFNDWRYCDLATNVVQ